MVIALIHIYDISSALLGPKIAILDQKMCEIRLNTIIPIQLHFQKKAVTINLIIITIHRPAGCAYYNQQEKANIFIGWNKTFQALSRFFNGCFKIIEYLWGPTNIRLVYIYGYFSHLWTDFNQTKMILSFKLYAL